MMDWWLQQFFLYCERGSDPSFWAEPFNALSNGAFLVTAVLAGRQMSRMGPTGGWCAEHGLIALAGIIGLASFLFHTTAARWAFALDTGSIAALSFAYLVYALRRFLGASWSATAGALCALCVGFAAMRFVPCPASGLLPITAAAGHPCLNGSLGYVPVVAAMAIVGGVLSVRGHGAAPFLLSAGAVFFVSLAVRSADTEICAASVIFGRARGTHALWHLLNALAIYLLLVAAVRERRQI